MMVAEWWTREEYEKNIVLLSDGTVQTDATMEQLGPVLAAQGITVQQKQRAKCWRH
jgi:hypothetical protein